MIKIGDLILPDTANGLRWSDEFTWTPIVQTVEYSITGTMLVQSAERQAGRPLTLTGGAKWAWIQRSELLELIELLETNATNSITLTLQDGRQVPVIPRHDNAGPVAAKPLPVVSDSGPADPQQTALYSLESLRFFIVGDII